MIKSWIVFSLVACVPRYKDLDGLEAHEARLFVDKLKAESPFMIFLGLQVTSIAFILLPLLTVGIPLPAQWLSKKQLTRHVEKIYNSPFYRIRQLMMVHKMMAGYCWGQSDKVRHHFGMQPYPEDPGTWRKS